MSGTELYMKYEILEQIVELIHQVFFIYNPQENRIIHVNNAFEKVWARSSNDLLHNIETVIATVHPEDTAYIHEQYKILLEESIVKDAEFRILLPDNSSKWICLTAYYMDVDGKNLIAGVAEDISSIKEYHYNILKFNAKKNSVLEILSHDLSAPFATIQGMISLLQKKMSRQTDTSVYEVLQIIEETCKRGRNLIKDFVDNEFLESSQIMLNKERIDIVMKVRQMMEEYKKSSLFLAKKFNLETQHDSLFIVIDEMKFMQVLNNLISNALKFTADDGEISIAITDEGDKILFTVRDNGIGIPEEMHSCLFDKFTQARRPGIRGEQSTGLGMSIIKKIIELHGGQISVESREGKGTTFYIEIPKNE